MKHIPFVKTFFLCLVMIVGFSFTVAAAEYCQHSTICASCQVVAPPGGTVSCGGVIDAMCTAFNADGSVYAYVVDRCDSGLLCI